MAYTSGLYSSMIEKYNLYSYSKITEGEKTKLGLKDALEYLKDSEKSRMESIRFTWSTYVDYQKKNNSVKDSQTLKNEGKKKEKKYKKVVSAANRSIDNFINLVYGNYGEIPKLERERALMNDIVGLNIENKEINKIAKQIRNELSKQIKIKEKEAIRETKKGRKAIAATINYTKYLSNSSREKAAKNYYYFARAIYDKVSTFSHIPRPNIESLKDKGKNIKISDGYVKDVKEKIESRGEFNSDNIQKKSEKIIEKLNEISLSLTSIDDKNLKNDIKKETPTISRIVSPKLVSVSKENYEKITKSKLAVVDIEMIQTIVDKSTFGASINRKRIEKLKQELKEQINIELKKQRKLESVTNKAERIINFAKENTNGISRTVDDYIQNKKDISSRERKIDELEEKQMKITSEEEKLYASPQYLEEEYVAGGDVRVKHIEIDKSSDFSKLMHQQEEVSEKIDENKKEIEDRKNIRISLPEQYKNLKKKIKENSELKKAIDTINKEKGRSL